MIFSFNPFSVADDGDEDGENAFGCEAIFDKDNGQCMATSHFASPQRWCFFGGNELGHCRISRFSTYHDH